MKDEEYKAGGNMQRCPYIHEMKERLLGEQVPARPQLVPQPPPPTPPALPSPPEPPATAAAAATAPQMDQQRLRPALHQPVATVVKLNPDGYGSHTSPTHQRLDRTPLMGKEPEDEFHYVTQKVFPKNAKTSLFIIMSFVYAKLLVVVCLAYVISDVVTPNIRPLYYYYEGFFTYLYGSSILFLLYVFCFLLQESSCCSGAEKEVKVKPPPKQKSKEKEKEKQKEKEREKEKKKEEEKKKKEEKEKQKKEKKEKEKNKDKKDKKQEKGTYRRNSEGVVDAAAVPSARARCRRKTTQNDHSHGSFFLRIGAIAFGLGTMIYNGLEFGSFFEIPFTSPCYKILRGVNPVLQMIFTFMQMYFIFMNSRLNIHRFKVIARFGLMHVVATNICVWIRTLVLEYNKEVVAYYKRMLNFTIPSNATILVADEPEAMGNGTELLDDIIPEAFRALIANRSNETDAERCGKVNIMGTIVQDSAPYLYPFIIEYSLIGAAVIYVMWKHIGRNPRYVTPEDLEHRLEVMLSRRAAAMAQAQQGRVDCVGASKGLFFGLLLLVGSLICLILFFVLVHHPDFGLLAIYLADVSHCLLMLLSMVAIIVGFVRVQQLKFKTEEQSDLNDILLRISAFGLFLYAVFSVIAGHRDAFTREPNLLVMATNVMAVLQVILQLLFIADVSRRRVHLPEHDRSKPGRQVVTFLLVCNIAMWIVYTFEVQKVDADPVQLDFYGFLAWALVRRVTLPLCIFHRFHSAVTLAEIWKTSYKARLE